ncbi:MAG: HAMP domain-containing histidine kinase [Cyclobacteriaceae bacterium]|nr:HAMP domain-containing histidine kinase [Cyclobacteriaceae bacterium]
MSLWNKIGTIGIKPGFERERNRVIILGNRVTLLLALFIFLLTLVSFLFFGFIRTTIISLFCSFLFLTPLLLNYLGHPNMGRIILSVLIGSVSLVVSVADKYDNTILEELQYFEFRLTMIAASIFPFVIFNLKEHKLWISAQSFNLLCIVLYDPIHEWFGVGYYQLGFTAPNYYFINYMVGAAFLVIAASTYFLKFSFEKYENENIKLIKQLSLKQKELLYANQVIDDQRKMLSIENEKLNEDLVKKNEQLSVTNQELISHNNNLQQFSYTISHNLRGPVASLKGLFNLINENEMGEENKHLVSHLSKSIAALDTTIKDLNQIMDMRKDVSNSKETVRLTDLIKDVKQLLENEIAEHEVWLTTQLDANELVTVRAMLQSIIYNLISNAIKYRSPDKQVIINIRSKWVGTKMQVEVQDNGLGIDLERFKGNLFGLYKRFHNHTEGKGLGLFLVKLQTEMLGGTINVESKPGVGSTFIVVV